MLAAIRNWWQGVSKGNYAYANKERAVWHREGPNTTVRELSVEYYWGVKAKRLMLSLAIDSDDDHLYSFRLGIPFLFNWYFGISAPKNRFTNWYTGDDCLLGGREVGFSIDKDFVCWYLFKSMNGSGSRKFCGWGQTLMWHDIFIGDSKFELASTKTQDTVVAIPRTVNFPNGHQTVPFTATIETFVRHHKRWYMRHYKPVEWRITLAPEVDIIVHGKRGDEKMYEITFAAETLDEAKLRYAESIKRDMERY